MNNKIEFDQTEFVQFQFYEILDDLIHTNNDPGFQKDYHKVVELFDSGQIFIDIKISPVAYTTITGGIYQINPHTRAYAIGIVIPRDFNRYEFIPSSVARVIRHVAKCHHTDIETPPMVGQRVMVDQIDRRFPLSYINVEFALRIKLSG